VRAVTIKDEQITVQEHPDPEPGDGEVLVRVRAAGLNGADIHQLRGGYPAPPGSPQDIPGLELAGEVVTRGPGAERFELGDRVMGIVGGGGQAELAVVNERVLMPVPEALSFNEAGGTPEVFTTAHDALFTQAQLQMGEHLLVHGGAGGVGTAAIQLGRAAGARVTATVRNTDLRENVAELGAEVVAPDNFANAGPYDVILELVGAVNLTDNLRSLNILGRISVIGMGAGATGEMNLGMLLVKRGRIHGSTLRSRPLEAKAMTARGMERSVLPLLDSGRVRVLIAATYSLERAREAYEHFTRGGKLGKIILVMPD
jgi:putative PIG3 family NAD(P)H quinone oxidoreductase